MAKHRRGQSLVEFALVALVMYLMLAAIIEFGRIYFGAETIQSTVDLAAREFARTPAPPDITISEGLDQLTVFQGIYDERFLVIDIQQAAAQAGSLQNYVNTLPIVNQQLFPLMIYSQADQYVPQNGNNQQGPTRPMLHFPGALVPDPNPSTAPAGALNDGYVVRVPVITSRQSTGTSGGNGLPTGTSQDEVVEWHRVLEAINPLSDTFPLFNDSGTPVVNGGVVALRLNYPFQAASMSSYPWDPANPSQLHVVDPYIAPGTDTEAGYSDTGVTANDPFNIMGGQQPVTPGYSPLYEGQYSLGARQAVGQTVRPFRKTISCQAVYRRELYGPAVSSSSSGS
ncbi:MAG TPA: TadE/TadG family type IV pilus assembly protein [Pirellulales bacterium]|nr:TadE/TadG family type IV pilus assembly protein [Pirellulales bacterium]